MIVEDQRVMCFFTGSYGDYQWLESYPDVDTFFNTCPESIVGKYLSITSADSGEFRPDADDVSAGWTTAEGIAYGPRIHSIDTLPKYFSCPFAELYVYDEPTPIGRRCKGYLPDIGPPDIFPFVNYLVSDFGGPEIKDVRDGFWKQLSWMRPVSYIASQGGILFVSRDPACFESVRRGLENWIWPDGSPGK